MAKPAPMEAGNLAIFGRTGFLLQAVPSIRRHWPWEENLAAMIDECRRVASTGGGAYL